MRVIEQDEYFKLKVSYQGQYGLKIDQDDTENGIENICVDKQGAKQLIEILKEFVNEN